MLFKDKVDKERLKKKWKQIKNKPRVKKLLKEIKKNKKSNSNSKY